MDYVKIGLAFLKAYNATVALLRSWRDRLAGRNEVIVEVKANSDDALKKADDARDAQSRHDADGDRLRIDDGYRRD